eukprot:gb/GFBE01071639.1/.p1 GENE.gb/GFBE01071639.1/~~gb/GFBE01071639.1/.p1  ORF type:complete len:295 (+),score=51.58 gb/GFBE01071639.1/:1-885(+)
MTALYNTDCWQGNSTGDSRKCKGNIKASTACYGGMMRGWSRNRNGVCSRSRKGSQEPVEARRAGSCSSTPPRPVQDTQKVCTSKSKMRRPEVKVNEQLKVQEAKVKEVFGCLPADQTFVPRSIDRKTLCQSLSAVYQSLVTLGTQKGAEERLTRFHSKVEPTLGVKPYLERLWQYFGCSESCHVLALVYIDRLVKMNPDFVVSGLTIHRLLAVTTVMGAKYVDDIYYSNSHYAKVCGLSLKELNNLEVTFLSMVRWKLGVTVEEYDSYLNQVLMAAGGCTTEADGSPGSYTAQV